MTRPARVGRSARWARILTGVLLVAGSALAGAPAMTQAAAQKVPPVLSPVQPDPDPAHWIVPAAKEWRAAGGTLTLKPAVRIVLPVAATSAERGTADELARGLREIAGLRAAIVTGGGRDGDIVLVRDAATGAKGSTRAQGPEAYGIDISGRATLRAEASIGLLHATRSLLQLLRHDRAGRTLPQGQLRDWPNFPVRAMMIDVGRKFYQMPALERLLRDMAWLKLNTLHLHFTDWPAFRLDSPRYPGLAARESYDRADIARLEALAARLGITIIPEIDLPAHAVALTRYRPTLAFRCESMRQSPWLTKAIGREAATGMAWTVDITRQENRDWLAGLVDEFIPWFSGPYFHIGGDEYQYDADKVKCPELMAATRARGLAHPGDVFVEWINEMNARVRARGKTTMIWNWWRFGDDRTSIQPDRNIVAQVWNAPRLAGILADGYKVIAAPEDEFYISPGLANKDGTGYGVFDSAAIYERKRFDRRPEILGYMAALWADNAENLSDREMLGLTEMPMRVLSERLWADRGSDTLDAFRARSDRAGSQP